MPNPTTQTKKKPTGYCECCKQRYDNLKQHLTSAQHETFEKNQSNFKELDEFVNGKLNFQFFLNKHNLNMSGDGKSPNAVSRVATTDSTSESRLTRTRRDDEFYSNEENVNLDELREFAKTFRKNRQALGFTQTDVVEALVDTELAKEANCTEATISRFEKLDITPRSGAKMRPVLETWLNNTKLKFGDRWCFILQSFYWDKYRLKHAE